MTTLDIVAALEEVKARQAVERLVAEFALGYDNQDLDRVMATWHPEAVWTIAPDRVLDGLDAIRAAIQGHWAKYETHHWFTNLSLIGSGDVMRGEFTADAILRDRSGAILREAGAVVDEYVKADGKWLVRRRALTITLKEHLTQR
jgi:uncharacterized protein (TIGR02246 family)